MHARLHVMRLGASRLAYVAPTLVVIIGGIDVAQARVLRLASLQIVDHLDGEPNLATFRLHKTFTPTPGQEIQIGLGSREPAQLIFAGHIQTVRKVYEGDTPAHVAYDITAMSYEWLLNKQMVTTRYVNQSATAIATDLIQRFTTDGFTTARVTLGLPVLDELTLTFARVSEALDTLARRIGGYWYVDYGRALHLFITPTESAHAIVDANVHSAADIALTTDVAAARTRVIVQGAGARTTAPVAVGVTLVPVDSTAPFSASGGTAIQGTTRLTYTGRVLGGVGTNVGSAGGPGAPTPSVSGTTVGGVSGTVRYRITFRAAQGETTPGTPSAPVTAPAVAPPGTLSAPTPIAGGPIVGTVYYVCTFRTKYGETVASPPRAFTGVAIGAPGAPTVQALPAPGRLAGVYRYRTTYSTRRGETLASGGDSSVTVVAFPVPAAPSVALNGFGPLVGLYGYKVTFVSALGETTAGGLGSRTAAAFGPVPGPATLAPGSAIGRLLGTYLYRLTYVTARGETTVGTAASITVTAHTAGAPNGNLQSTAVVGPLIGSYRWKISFVSDLGETLSPATGSIATAALTASAPSVSGDGTSQEIAYAVAYYHPVYGVSNVSARTVDTNKGASPVVGINGLPAGCGAYVYSTGTVASGQGSSAPLHQVATLGIGETSFTHVAQTGPAISATPATLGRYGRVEAIPAGPTGTTQRRIYRTKAGGSTYFLVGQIDGNAGGETFLDGVADDNLTVTAPTSNLNGRPVVLSNLPQGPAGTLGRRIYRTRAGGSEYFRIGQIDNNTFGVTYTDDAPDGGLTMNPPAAASAGGESHTLTIPTGPTGTLARRLYRTEADRSVYRLLAEIPDNATGTFVDAYADGELGEVTEPLQHTAGGQNVSVTNIPIGPGGGLEITAVTVYRTTAGGNDFFAVRRLTPGVTTFVDDVPDGNLGPPAPLLHTAGGYSAQLSVPVGPTGVTGTRFYRTVMGGSSAGPFLLCAQHTGNGAGTVVDSKADDDLGAEPPPAVSSAGGATILVDGIQVGPPGVTARRLYRTKADGTDYFFVAQLSDNTTGSFLDDRTDDQLNDLAPTEGSIGALVGETTLRVLDAAAFPPGGGWCRVESQVIRYAAVSGSTLTGIPAAGVGAIVAAIRAGAAVVVEPQLTGVAGVLAELVEGTTIQLLVTRDDLAAQDALAALIGGGSSGIFEEYIHDDRLSQAEAEERGDAKLLELKDPIRTVTYRTRDITTTSGRLVTFDLAPPTTITGSFKIQQVTITNLDPLNRIPPLRQVIASSRRESFEALVRLLKRQAV
jgi:hypothetical protein